MALQFSRDSKVFVELDDGNSPNQIWEVPVLDGFSFSQSLNTTEITINEAGDISRRSRLVFNDSLAPVEWSFSTYVRPFVSAGSGGGAADDAAYVHAVEEAMWAMFLGADEWTSGVFSNSRISPTDPINDTDGTQAIWNFDSSNFSTYPENWNIYFAFQPPSGTAQVYKLTNAVCGSVTIDFDIEGIATLQWSGTAGAIVDQTTTVPSRTIYEKITGTDTFIRNKISTVSLVRTDVSPDLTYNIVLTGGSISLENNISYLTPEELGKVNRPFSNITGTRSVSGSLTCYLDTAVDRSADLLADLAGDTNRVRNVFDMAINIGGTTASTNRLVFDLPTAHIQIPNLGIEDLLTLEINFEGHVSAGNVDNTDEATIIYKA